MLKSLHVSGALGATLAAAAILMVTMGTRQSLGLFVGPLNTTTGLGIATVSFALAMGQLAWGAVQPVAGAASDRWGPRPVLAAGIALLALGFAITPWMRAGWSLTLTLGLLSATGAGMSGFSVLIGAAVQRVPARARGTASGIINAGGSFGQFVFAPVSQALISLLGWMGALWALAAMALASLPLAGRLGPRAPELYTVPELSASSAATAASPQNDKENNAQNRFGTMMRVALSDRSYWLLHASYFACGFHIAFLSTHLPTEVGLCGLSPTVASGSIAIIGLANVAGSLIIGHLTTRYRSKMILFWMYASRVALILVYLALPRQPWVFYLFAIGLGMTWLATVPPTASIIGKLFGVRYLGTLFGLTVFTHQIGGFFGAWLGGVAVAHWGNLMAVWWVDIALAALAALANLPIREAPLPRPALAGQK